MKKLSAALLALLLILTGCQKQQRQADIRLPEPETPAAEETIAEPAEEPEQESVSSCTRTSVRSPEAVYAAHQIKSTYTFGSPGVGSSVPYGALFNRRISVYENGQISSFSRM